MVNFTWADRGSEDKVELLGAVIFDEGSGESILN